MYPMYTWRLFDFGIWREKNMGKGDQVWEGQPPKMRGVWVMLSNNMPPAMSIAMFLARSTVRSTVTSTVMFIIGVRG